MVLGREMLEAMGLEKDNIDKVMAAHGKVVESVKKDLQVKEAELTTTQGQLKKANEEIESFRDLDLDEIEAKADKYKKDYEQLEADTKEQLAAVQFEHELENAIRDSNARNVTAVKALLDIDSLKASKNRSDDIKQALESTKEANDYLFEPNGPSGTGGSMGAGERRRKDLTREDILSIEDPIERKRTIADNLKLFN